MLINKFLFKNIFSQKPTNAMKRLTVLCLLVLFVCSVVDAQKRYDELEYPDLNEFQKPQDVYNR